MRVNLNRISDGYFRTMGVAADPPGRDFDWIGREPRQSAIVNEAFVARHLAWPVGRSASRLRLSLARTTRRSRSSASSPTLASHLAARRRSQPTIFVPLVA